MVQKYQNEIPPIFYYGISTKTSEKDLKIPNLQALTLGRIIKITLYFEFCEAQARVRQGSARDGSQGERPQSLNPCQELTLKLVATFPPTTTTTQKSLI